MSHDRTRNGARRRVLYEAFLCLRPPLASRVVAGALAVSNTQWLELGKYSA